MQTLRRIIAREVRFITTEEVGMPLLILGFPLVCAFVLVVFFPQ